MVKTLSLFLSLAFCALSGGCLSDFGVGENRIDFGYRYSVLEDSFSPAIVNDTLIVRVGYSGCSGQHGFAVQYRFSGSSNVELWLHKDTPDQMCDAYWNELRRWRLPQSIRTTQSIMLLDSSGRQYKLR